MSLHFFYLQKNFFAASCIIFLLARSINYEILENEKLIHHSYVKMNLEILMETTRLMYCNTVFCFTMELATKRTSI